MARSQVVGGVAIDLIANTARWVKGFDKAKRHHKAFASDLKSTAARIARYAAGYLAVRQMVRSFNEQRQAIDKLAKTSEKLGIPTARLSELQYAAQITGVQTNKLNMAMQRMTRRVSEAAGGMGEAQTAIKELGLDAGKLAAKSPDEMFMDVAKAMENVGSQGEKVRLAFKLFDSEGVDLVNTLNLGTQGLEDMYAQAQKLGWSITRVDAARVVAANDALTRLSILGQSIARSITVEIAPTIEAASNAFVDWATEGKSAGETVMGAMQTAATAMSYILDTADLIQAGFFKLGAVVSSVAAAFVKDFEQKIRAVGKLGWVIDQLELTYLKVRATIITGLHETAVIANDITGEGTGTVLKLGLMAAKSVQHIREVQEGLAAGTSGFEASINKTADAVGKSAVSLTKSMEDGFRLAEEAMDRVYSGERREQIIAFFADIKKAQLLQTSAALEANKNIASNTVDGLTSEQRLRVKHTNFILNGISSVNDAAEGSAKAQFEVNKALGIANATISTYEAVMKYHAKGQWGMAIAAGAIGIAQVAAIASTTFGGGGAGGGSVPALSDDGGVERQTQDVSITLVGDSFGREGTLDLIGRINEAVGDGARLRTT